jgi:hypothetical protein
MPHLRYGQPAATRFLCLSFILPGRHHYRIYGGTARCYCHSIFCRRLNITVFHPRHSHIFVVVGVHDGAWNRKSDDEGTAPVGLGDVGGAAVDDERVDA